jgi:hypothetical protein
VPAQDLHARVFAWLTLADERNLVACWVAGQQLQGMAGNRHNGAQSQFGSLP